MPMIWHIYLPNLSQWNKITKNRRCLIMLVFILKSKWSIEIINTYSSIDLLSTQSCLVSNAKNSLQSLLRFSNRTLSHSYMYGTIIYLLKALLFRQNDPKIVKAYPMRIIILHIAPPSINPRILPKNFIFFSIILTVYTCITFARKNIKFMKKK